MALVKCEQLQVISNSVSFEPPHPPHHPLFLLGYYLTTAVRPISITCSGCCIFWFVLKFVKSNCIIPKIQRIILLTLLLILSCQHLFHNWTEGHCFSLANIFFSLFLMGSGQMVVVNRITDLCVSQFFDHCYNTSA